jgi:hypothetical protein
MFPFGLTKGECVSKSRPNLSASQSNVATSSPINVITYQRFIISGEKKCPPQAVTRTLQGHSWDFLLSDSTMKPLKLLKVLLPVSRMTKSFSLKLIVLNSPHPNSASVDDRDTVG